MTYSTNIPNAAGWWLWKEDERAKPERLLIVVSGTYAEVATDDAVAEALGVPESKVWNFWEMTDCRRMGGLWEQEGIAQWVGKRVRKTSIKPFSSGLQINTVKGIVPHPQKRKHPPAFIFEEDDSYVCCTNCVLADEHTK